MNTEITDKNKFEGWVLYDAECRFCLRLARRFHRTLAHRQFELLPLQTPWVRTRIGLEDSELLTEMRLLKPGGAVFSGADALREIARGFWWTWPFRQLSRIPAVMGFFRRGYRWIAHHRCCMVSACEIPTSPLEEQHHRSCKRTVFFEMP